MLGVANRVVKEQIRSEQRDRQLKTRLSEQTAGAETKEPWPLAKTITRLDERSRELILLRYYCGHSCKEIAEMMDMPLGSVTKSLSRAYAQLREMLVQERVRDEESEVQL
jgi:RNA polymerase sigma-70 factor (ECF subfamily)